MKIRAIFQVIITFILLFSLVQLVPISNDLQRLIDQQKQEVFQEDQYNFDDDQIYKLERFDNILKQENKRRNLDGVQQSASSKQNMINNQLILLQSQLKLKQIINSDSLDNVQNGDVQSPLDGSSNPPPPADNDSSDQAEQQLEQNLNNQQQELRDEERQKEIEKQKQQEELQKQEQIQQQQEQQQQQSQQEQQQQKEKQAQKEQQSKSTDQQAGQVQGTDQQTQQDQQQAPSGQQQADGQSQDQTQSSQQPESQGGADSGSKQQQQQQEQQQLPGQNQNITEAQQKEKLEEEACKKRNEGKDVFGQCPKKNKEITKSDAEAEAKRQEELEQLKNNIHFYLIGGFFCLFLILIMLIKQLNKFLSKFLEEYFRQSLKFIMIEVIILLAFNTLMQVMYYDNRLDVILGEQEEYNFNFYPFCIAISIFAISWLALSVYYSFYLQFNKKQYTNLENQWPNRQMILDFYESLVRKQDENNNVQQQITLEKVIEQNENQEQQKLEESQNNQQENNEKDQQQQIRESQGASKQENNNEVEDKKNLEGDQNSVKANIKNDQELSQEQRKQKRICVEQLEFFQMKQDFILPITHLSFIEPQILRHNFDFSEYLGRCSSLQMQNFFQISFASLVNVIVFITVCVLICLIEIWVVEISIVTLLNILLTFSLFYTWSHLVSIYYMLNKKVENPQEVFFYEYVYGEWHKMGFRTKYPPYLELVKLDQNSEVNKHFQLFWFNSPHLYIKILQLVVLTQLISIKFLFFRYEYYIQEDWVCACLFSFNILLVMCSIMYVAPNVIEFIVKTQSIQMMKNESLIKQVVFQNRNMITCAFTKFYRFLKFLRRQILNVEDEQQVSKQEFIQKQLKEIFQIQNTYKLEEIQKLADKCNLQLEADELYYLAQAAKQQNGEGEEGENINCVIDQASFQKAIMNFTNEISLDPYNVCYSLLQQLELESIQQIKRRQSDYEEGQSDISGQQQQEEDQNKNQEHKHDFQFYKELVQLCPTMNLEQKQIIQSEIDDLVQGVYNSGKIAEKIFDLSEFCLLIRDSIEGMPR